MKVFFDVDGVLIDGWHADITLRKAWDATIHTDLDVDRNTFRRLLFGRPPDRLTSRMFECITGKCDLKVALADILPQIGYRGSIDGFMRYWFEKDSNMNADVFRLVRGIRECGGAQTYVATGQEHYRARFLWEELGFSSYFDGIFYSADIGYPKTDVRFFEAINRTLGIATEERPLFFDDQPEVVETAGEAGWDGMVFRSPCDIQAHPRLRHLWS